MSDMTPESEVKIFGSLEEWTRFTESKIWKDMTREMIVWANIATSKYDTCKDMAEVGKLNGVREALSNVLQIPKMFINALELAEKAAEKKEEANNG